MSDMTTSTDIDLNKFLAEEVMGWKTHPEKDYGYWIHLKDEDPYMPNSRLGLDGKKILASTYWNPQTDLNQAVMCEGEFSYDEWETQHRRDLLGSWRVVIRNLKTDRTHTGINESLAMAICLAIYGTKKGEK